MQTVKHLLRIETDSLRVGLSSDFVREIIHVPPHRNYVFGKEVAAIANTCPSHNPMLLAGWMIVYENWGLFNTINSSPYVAKHF